MWNRLETCLSLFGGKLLLTSYHCLDTIVHVLDEVDFASSKSSPIGDVVDVVSRLRVLTMDSSDLDIVLVSNSLELVHLFTKVWKLDMDRGSESSTKVGWA